jgi:hypothetical protein
MKKTSRGRKKTHSYSPSSEKQDTLLVTTVITLGTNGTIRQETLTTLKQLGLSLPHAQAT